MTLGAPVLDPALLATFLQVVDTRSFTQAAARLGISQPTVSQQVRRLERAVDRTLIARDTRDMQLTDAGDAMAGFARTILAAHRAAEAYFGGSAVTGRLRFGTADDLAITQLPRILRHFRQLHPQIELELTVTQSGPLQRRLLAGQLDLILTKTTVDEQPPERRVGRDRMVWVGLERTLVEPGATVPLIAYRAPSISRQMAIDALERAGRTWRITCSTRDVNGVLAAVRAGMGVAVLPQALIPTDLVKVTTRLQLPELDEVDYVLMANPAGPRESIEALTSAIMSRGVTRAS
jgi:DNA-binding transcriptional LysR family regulator